MMDIHSLAKQGDVEAVRQLLSRGVAVDLRDDSDLTPLACASASTNANSAMLTLLIDSGADVNASVDGGKKHPVSMAACTGDLEKVQTLAGAGANLNAESKSGYTALINVMYKLFDSEQLVPMIKLLIRLGSDMDCETSYGESPLSVSSHVGRFDAVRVLIDSGAAPSPLQWNALHTAVATGTAEDVKRQISGDDLHKQDCWERTPWLIASVVGSIEKAKLILAAGADLTDTDRGGSSALAICASSGNVEMLSWLLEVGSHIEAVDGADNDSLVIAAQAGETECVRLLLEAGADWSRENEYNAGNKVLGKQVASVIATALENIKTGQ